MAHVYDLTPIQKNDDIEKSRPRPELSKLVLLHQITSGNEGMREDSITILYVGVEKIFLNINGAKVYSATTNNKPERHEILFT